MCVLGTVLAWLPTPREPDPDWLFAQADAAGWVHTDPVVRERLVDNLRFAGVQGSDEALFQTALSLGMARTDPVVRRRFQSRLRGVLDASLPDPTEAELAAYFRAHLADYRPPPVLLLSREGREERGTLPRLERRLGLSLQDAGVGEVVDGWQVLRREALPMPTLAEVRARVEADWRADALPAHRQARLAQLGAP